MRHLERNNNNNNNVVVVSDMEKRCARPIQTEKNKVGVERMDIFISYFS
jgi:hypothetical protein